MGLIRSPTRATNAELRLDLDAAQAQLNALETQVDALPQGYITDAGSFTIEPSHNGKEVRCSGAGQTIEIDLQANQPYQANFYIPKIYVVTPDASTNIINIAAVGGVTLNDIDGNTLSFSTGGEVALLLKLSNNNWICRIMRSVI